jgi:hypothetical protein
MRNLAGTRLITFNSKTQKTLCSVDSSLPTPRIAFYATESTCPQIMCRRGIDKSPELPANDVVWMQIMLKAEGFWCCASSDNVVVQFLCGKKRKDIKDGKRRQS